jgi:serine/threonine-protein kinase
VASAGSRVGSWFGPYRLTQLLGSGGFGEVYAAHDADKDRMVALKLMTAAYSADPIFRQRLFREASTAGRLNEPHVVPIHSYGEIDGQLYIDMRLVDGTDLQKLLAHTGPLDPNRAVWIIRQIAAALDAAHAATLVHRDVKPANILLTGEDFAYLADFGLANAATDTKLTNTGTTIGTMAYLAPERFTHLATPDHRADIYALTCVLYECLTGTPPYQATDLPGLMGAHLNAPIPQPSHHRGVPAAFDDVIAIGMAKEPINRYPTAGALATAARYALTTPNLNPYQANTHTAPTNSNPHQANTQAAPSDGAIQTHWSTPTPTPTRRPSRRALITTALTAITAIIAVTGIVTLTHRPTHPKTADHASQQTPLGRETTLPFSFANLYGVAVDRDNNIYAVGNATGMSGRNPAVMKLTPGSDTPTKLPFSDLNWPTALAVDGAGNVYVLDLGDHGTRVRKLAAGSTSSVELPFPTSDFTPAGIAADPAGNLYVTDGVTDGTDKLWKLPVGSDSPITLPFPGHISSNIAVADTGDIYIATIPKVVKWSPHSGQATEQPYPLTVIPGGVAVDKAGNVYVTDGSGNEVLMLPVGTTRQVRMPFTGLKWPQGVAVDADGNVYVANQGNNRVLKLAAQ